jgi:hypothetical protein
MVVLPATSIALNTPALVSFAIRVPLYKNTRSDPDCCTVKFVVIKLAAFVAFVAFVAVAALPVVFWFNVGNVQLAKLPDDGVPRAGVTSVGLLESTALPVPVDVVTPVPPLATGKVPVTPVVKGSPVTLVITPLAGVPNAGVVSVGLVSVLFVSVCVPVSVATVESIATVTGEEPL